MKGKQKGVYEPPTTAIVEMNTQGMLCWSNEVYSSIWFFNANDGEWGRNGYDTGGNPATWN